MSTEIFFQLGLGLAILLCAFVSGFILIFSIVVMPGIGRLGDREFLRGFQVMDRIIQENHPLFALVWGGSVITLLLTMLFGFWQLAGINRLLLVGAAIVYIFGVQLPTVMVNLPLNNRVQTLALESLSTGQLKAERDHFEARWNRWNQIRTGLAILATIILVLLLIFL